MEVSPSIAHGDATANSATKKPMMKSGMMLTEMSSHVSRSEDGGCHVRR
ncbi:hypothetical protein [Halorussus caseinilyticus]|uniref:Uncharacterized protein n=1 Tax=Halorussus caseinilyticus TaxID=3034025 RepID=A0ABD5WM29_9EURY